MSNFEVEYHPAQSALEGLLASIDRPGEYCTHGRLFAPLPRLEVAGAGLIPFPVPEAQTRALIAAAERAPYGRGPETVLDRSVRDCWQIDADKVDVGGGGWRDTLAQIVDRAADGLGCPRERTEARLYKLLVYEPGGFFSAHRDSEKATGMVGTLVISLPVAGTGGELAIRHKKSEAVIDLRTEDPSELAFAAFYADCVHETRPVVTGHRIVLVYQLLLRGGDHGGLERAPDYDVLTKRIAALLAQWERSTQGAEKIVWLLEHEYSEEGLSFSALKNTDAAVARTLAEAARRVVGVARSRQVDRPGDLDPARAGAHHVHGVGQEHRLAQVVGDQDHGEPLALPPEVRRHMPSVPSQSTLLTLDFSPAARRELAARAPRVEALLAERSAAGLDVQAATGGGAERVALEMLPRLLEDLFFTHWQAKDATVLTYTLCLLHHAGATPQRVSDYAAEVLRLFWQVLLPGKASVHVRSFIENYAVFCRRVLEPLGVVEIEGEVDRVQPSHARCRMTAGPLLHSFFRLSRYWE